MIEDILRRDVPVPDRFVESVLRSTGVAHMASLHPSPVGEVVVVRRNRAVTAIAPEQHADEMLAGYERRTGIPAYVEDTPPERWSAQVEEALSTGNASQIAVNLVGVSRFQQDVLSAAATIPVGETRPYGWVAREARHPGAVRAVGTALARNPIPLIIPCHRVVRADGTLGQYAFGEPMKAALLDSEGFSPRLDAPLVGAARGEVVCYPTCRHARRIKQPVAFSSVAAAEAAGYRPCRVCRPA